VSKKKKRPVSKSRGGRISELERWLDQASLQLARSDYDGTIATAQQVLKRAASPAQRAEALERAGVAYSMLQQFDTAYVALSQALAIRPNDSHLWYNRGLSCRFTMRSGQAVRDFERAVALEQDPALVSKFTQELEFSYQIAQQSRTLRGPDFTLEQLIEQEERFQTAVQMMEREQWVGAEQAFRQVIAMGDCLPQPWGNVGACLIMQQRYDEAEIALRRALDIDPKYEFARRNLKALPAIRRSSEPLMSRISGPFDGHTIKKSIMFHLEK
jgi:tetratricopeptide (TPR) repeat protein